MVIMIPLSRKITEEVARLLEALVPSEFKRQVEALMIDTSPSGEHLKSFIFGKAHQTKVDVDPDLRNVLPGFVYNRITDKELYKKYPDLVFTLNFLVPYLVMMHSSKDLKNFNVDTLHKYIKAHTKEAPMTLYRAQRLDKEQHKDVYAGIREYLEKESVSNFPTKISIPAIPFCGFTKTAKRAESAAYGSGIFGPIGDCFIMKIKTQPIIDIYEYSKMILSVFQSVTGSMPDALHTIKVYGAGEEEVLAVQPALELDVKTQVMWFKIGNRVVTPEEIFDSKSVVKSSNELVGNDTMFVTMNKRSSMMDKETTIRTRVRTESVDAMPDYFKGGRFGNFMATGGNIGSDYKAYTSPQKDGDVYDKDVYKRIGMKIYFYVW